MVRGRIVATIASFLAGVVSTFLMFNLLANVAFSSTVTVNWVAADAELGVIILALSTLTYLSLKPREKHD